MTALFRVFLASLVMILFFLFYMMSMPGVSPTGPLPALNRTETDIVGRLQTHVRLLADDIGERHFQVKPALDRAADYIEKQFSAIGYQPVSEYFGDGTATYRNIVAGIRGYDFPDDILVIGAHYDTVWLSPGADDNASGVAVLLETAALLRKRSLARSVRFVAFTNEEESFFATDLMGSRVHIRNAIENNEHISGMISLEMLGYYSNEPGSQRYPFPLNYFYPDSASFIAFVGNLRSRPLLRHSIRYFRDSGRFPATGLTAPAVLVPDIRRSDHYSFWQYGIPAFMLTDTANFRNPHYHSGDDLPKTLDYEAMTRVTMATADMIESLVNR